MILLMAIMMFFVFHKIPCIEKKTNVQVFRKEIKTTKGRAGRTTSDIFVKKNFLIRGPINRPRYLPKNYP
jgi:hypothetical protein